MGGAAVSGCRDLAARCERWWAGRGLAVVPSFPLVHEDRTVFFVNAGVTPFKDVMLRGERLDPVAVIQRCLRAYFEEGARLCFDMMTVVGPAAALEPISAGLFDLLIGELGLCGDRLSVVLDPADRDLVCAVAGALGEERLHKQSGNDPHFWTRWTFGHQQHLRGRGLTVVYRRERPPCGRCCDLWCGCGRHLSLGNVIVVEHEASGRGYLDVGFGIQRLAEAVDVDELDDGPALASLERLLGGRLDGPALRVLLDQYRAVFTLAGAGVESAARGKGYVLRKLLRAVFDRLDPTRFVDEALAAARALLDTEPVAGRERVLAAIVTDGARYTRALDRGRREARRYLTRRPAIAPQELLAHLQSTFGLSAAVAEAALVERVTALPQKATPPSGAAPAETVRCMV
jgi:alanyl-tRNA synthetase